jgi:tetratricopeptide (TPR) repeat protein
MAGDRASDLFSHNQASAAYLQTLEALEQIDGDDANTVRRIDVTLKLAREASFSPTEEVLHALEKAKQLAEHIDDAQRQVRVVVAIAASQYVSGQPRAAVELALQAIGSAKQSGLEELLIVPYLILGRGMFMTGGFRNCVDLVEQAQDLAARFGNDLDQWSGLGLGPNLGLLGAAYQQLGEIERGAQLGLQAIRTAESRSDRRQVAIAHLFYGGTDASLGRFDQCVEHLDLAAAICEEAGDLAGTQSALGWLGRALAWRGDIERGTACLDRALRMAEELGFMPWRPFMQANRCEIYIRTGRPADAVELATKAVDLAVETRQRSAEGEAHRALAWSMYYAGQESHDRVLDEFRTAVEVHRSTGGRVFVANALFELARFLKMIGRDDEAGQVEGEALALKEELGLSWLPMPALQPNTEVSGVP